MTADVRFITATNRDLHAAQDADEFLPDLYDRLAQLEIRMPPLRERGDDAVLLAEHFADQEGYAVPQEELERIVQGGSWPSNVRGVQKAVQNWLLEHPKYREKPAAASTGGLDRAKIEEALSGTGGNVKWAAERTGIPRRVSARTRGGAI